MVEYDSVQAPGRVFYSGFIAKGNRDYIYDWPNEDGEGRAESLNLSPMKPSSVMKI